MEKKIVNITNSIWSKKIYRKITIGQAIAISSSILITLIVSILLAIYTSLIWTLAVSLFLIILICIMNVKQCWALKIFWFYLKWLFSWKTKRTKQISSSNGIIKTKTKQFLLFEVTCCQQVGNPQDIEMKIQDVVTKISKFSNWSIINTQLPFDDLKENSIWVQTQKETYLNKHSIHDDDPVLKNIITNELLMNKFSSGEYNKNTFLFCLETDIHTRIDLILQDVQRVNKELSYQSFALQLLNDEIMESVKQNLFLFNKKIKNKSNHILASDEHNNKQYYHFFKIKNLPSFVDEGYLDFLNQIDLKNAILNFSINTYSFDNFKKETKIWENAIKNLEFEVDRAIKYRDKIQSETNLENILSINADLIANADTTQKFEIICCIIANTKQDLIKASYRAKEIIRKANQFELAISQFQQLKLFYSFQRNILESNSFKNRVLNILPNNLIAFSYPFLVGNNYLNHGWYTGQLFNGNPIFLNLNEGIKHNNSSLIIGKTGSGKSTFINFLIKNNMSSNGVKTILFDPKGEYTLNPEVLKMHPKIISLNDDKALCLNPFELSKTDSDADKINFMLNFFKIWFNDLWNDVLKNHLINTLKLCLQDGKWNFVDFYNKLRDKLPNDYENRKTILDIVKKLLPTGIFGYFAKTTKIDLDDKLVIFDLNEILINFNDLNKIKLMLIFKYLKSFIYNKSKLTQNNEKIQIIVDEFPAIANPTVPFVTTEFVSLIRLIRSYDASLILAMQDIVRLVSGDINSNESLKSVANNVEHKFLMQMNSEQLKIMQDIWGDSVELSDEEELQITTKFSYGDILYINKANRFYFNATDPNSPWTLFSQTEIDEYFHHQITKLSDKPITKSSDKPTKPRKKTKACQQQQQ